MNRYRIKYNGGRRWSVRCDMPNGNTRRVTPDMPFRWLAQAALGWCVGREA